MAIIGSDGDVAMRVGSSYDDKGTSAAKKSVTDTSRTLEQKWEALEQAQKKLGVTTQREKMEMVQAYKTLKASGVASTEELRQAQERLDQTLGKSPPLLEKVKQNWLQIAGTIYAATKAFDLMEKAANFDQQEQAFTNLAASHNANARQIVASLKEASGQTVSTAALMKSAGTAMLLGIPAEKLSRMMEIARASAKITGQSIEKSFADIGTGISRQSPLILDNLGITIKLTDAYKDYAAKHKTTVAALTETEKKQAFVNATMAAGEDILRRVGTHTMDAATATAIFKAKMEDAKIVIGKVLITITSFLSSIAFGFSTVFAGVIGIMARGLAEIVRLGQHLPIVGDKFKAAGDAIKGFSDFELEAAKKAAEMSKASTDVGLAVWKEKEAVKGYIGTRKEATGADAAGLEKKKALEEEIKKLSDAYLEATTTEREYIRLKADAMIADGRSVELVNQWVAAKEKALALQEEEQYDAHLQGYYDMVYGKIEANRQMFEQINAMAEQAVLNEEEREMLRHERMMEKLQAELLFLQEADMLKDEQALQFMIAREQAEDIHQQKLTAIRAKEAKKQAALETQKEMMIFNMKMQIGRQIVGLMRSLGGEHKAFALAAIALETVLNIIQAKQNTAVAVTRALAMDPTGVLAARVAALGAIQIGLIGAAGAVQAISAFKDSGGASPGSPGGEPIQTQEVSQTSNVFNTAPAEKEVIVVEKTVINVDGNVVDLSMLARDLIPYTKEAEGDKAF